MQLWFNKSRGFLGVGCDAKYSGDAAIAMRASFASSGSSLAALKFFDALVDLLTGSGQKQ